MTKPATSRGLRRHYRLLREAATILPVDLRVLRSRQGPLRPEIVALAADAAAEREQLVAAVGGQAASVQKQLLAADVAELGLVKRALLRIFAQTPDPETASRIATLAGARRSGLLALGLDEHRVERSLESYLAERDAAEEAGDLDANPHEAPQARRGGAIVDQGESPPETREDAGVAPLDLRGVPRDLPPLRAESGGSETDEVPK